jgi:nucleoid-associated protein YgaU
LNADHPVPPPPPANAPTAALPAPGTYYKVVRGDTLSGIAQKAYHAASKYPLIEKANPNLLDGPDQIYIGQILYIPVLDGVG